MIYYLLGLIYVLFSVVQYQLLGMCLVKKESYSYSFIIGFITYSFFVTILSLFVKIFNLPWKVFFYGMILIWAFITLLIAYNIKNKALVISKENIIFYIKKNWLYYVGALFLLVFSLSHVATIWSNNLTDDSYYLNMMASLPYIDHPYTTDPVTGFLGSGMSLERFINCFELEGSFYLYVLGIPVTLFSRVFLSLLNYFIMFMSIDAFLEKLTDNKSIFCQYFVVSIFSLIVMNAGFFFKAESTWTIISAAYFGSALVRITCPFIIMMPLININKLNIKKVIITFMSCMVMLGKSTCAIPIIFILAVGYLVSYKINNRYYFITLIPLIALIGSLIKNNVSLEEFTWNIIINNMTSMVCVFAFVVLLYLTIFNYNNKRVLCLILVAAVLSFVPIINNVYEMVTKYNFVSDRTWYTFFIFMIIISGYGIYNFIIDQLIKNKKIMLVRSGVFVIVVASVIGTVKIGTGMDNNFISIYKSNKYIIPQSTMDLANNLNDYCVKNHSELKVLMSAGLEIDGHKHFAAAVLRMYAPHIQSITGGLRVRPVIQSSQSQFNNFSTDDLNTFSYFEINPNNDTLIGLKKLNTIYPFDCLVILNANKKHKKLLSEIGYSSYNKVYDNQNRFYYEIFIKN